MHFCRKFDLYPTEVSFHKLTFFFHLISQDQPFIRKNQFLEILVLVFIDTNIFLFENSEGALQAKIEDIMLEFRDFLMKLDYSGGWESVQLETGEDFSKCRFLKFG